MFSVKKEYNRKKKTFKQDPTTQIDSFLFHKQTMKDQP